MWKTITKFPLYEINEFGVVRNTKTHYVTTQRMNKQGYLYVQLIDNGKNHVCLVHRLVAETFIPNPEHLPIVNHIDECCVHNSVDNLEWKTYEGNSNHGTRNERIVRDRKISIIAFDNNGITKYRYLSRYDASRDLNVSETAIRMAMKKRTKCLNLYWRAASIEPSDDEIELNLAWIDKTKEIKAKDSSQKHLGRVSVSALNENGLVLRLYPSINIAAADCGVSSTAICNAIKNKTKCKGLYWRKEI